jgi:hypothetical protein
VWIAFQVKNITNPTPFQVLREVHVGSVVWGCLVNIDHSAQPGQLQLCAFVRPSPFCWASVYT